MVTTDLRQSLGGSSWERLPLQLPGAPVLGRGGDGRAHAHSVAQVVSQSLRRPADFPSIADAMVTGDQVALVVDPSLPSAASVVRGAAEFLAQHDPETLHVQLWADPAERTVEAITRELQSVSVATKVWVHDPADREALRYVAADAAGDPVYLARAVVDSDLVIPLLAVRQNDADRWLHRCGIWPMLCDAQTQRRCSEVGYQPGLSAAQTVGVHVAVLVSPTAEGHAAAISCGTVRYLGDLLAAAESQNEHVEDETWPTAELIVAMIEGRDQQTWENVARAIIAASRHVEAGGAIVAWSEIQTEPPVAWQRAMADEASVRDWPSAVADVARDHRIYVRPGAAIESMGLAAIDDLAQLRQLAGQFSSVGVLRSAPLHVGPAVVFGGVDE